MAVRSYCINEAHAQYSSVYRLRHGSACRLHDCNCHRLQSMCDNGRPTTYTSDTPSHIAEATWLFSTPTGRPGGLTGAQVSTGGVPLTKSAPADHLQVLELAAPNLQRLHLLLMCRCSGVCGGGGRAALDPAPRGAAAVDGQVRAGHEGPRDQRRQRVQHLARRQRQRVHVPQQPLLLHLVEHLRHTKSIDQTSLLKFHAEPLPVPSAGIEKQPQQFHAHPYQDAALDWCEESLTTGAHVISEVKSRTEHAQYLKAGLFIKAGDLLFLEASSAGMQRGRQAAH